MAPPEAPDVVVEGAPALASVESAALVEAVEVEAAEVVWLLLACWVSPPW